MQQDKSVTMEKYYYLNIEYYKMMEEFHKEHSGIAVEPLTLKLLENCLKSLSDNEVVLEIGCGEGSITVWLAKNYPQLKFVGTDISPAGIEMAKEKAKNLSNVKFFVDDVENSKIESNSCSLIISQSVLEHLTDYRKALKECYRILRKDGRVLIRVGNGGRRRSGVKGFLIDLFNYILHLNKAVYLNPTFDLNGDALEEKRRKHQTNFDFVEIPSDVLIRDLKEFGFEINFFSTYKEASLLSPRYKNGNLLVKKLIECYVKFNIFPFNHMGRTIVILAKKI